MKSPIAIGSSRRTFLSQTSGALSMAASPWIGRAAASPNDRIGIGMIGLGGRGTDHLDELARLASAHNVQINAVCDVWRKAGEAAAEKLKRKTGHEPRRFTRFADLLDQPDVDAVVIA